MVKTESVEISSYLTVCVTNLIWSKVYPNHCFLDELETVSPSHHSCSERFYGENSYENQLTRSESRDFSLARTVTSGSCVKIDVDFFKTVRWLENFYKLSFH